MSTGFLEIAFVAKLMNVCVSVYVSVCMCLCLSVYLCVSVSVPVCICVCVLAPEAINNSLHEMHLY